MRKWADMIEAAHIRNAKCILERLCIEDDKQMPLLQPAIATLDVIDRVASTINADWSCMTRSSVFTDNCVTIDGDQIYEVHAGDLSANATLLFLDLCWRSRDNKRLSPRVSEKHVGGDLIAELQARGYLSIYVDRDGATRALFADKAREYASALGMEVGS